MNADLKSYIDRQVSLMEEAEANREDQKTLAAEIKDDGFTPATVKKLAALIISDKKARKAKALNEEMALYIREAGLHLDLGYETTVAEIVNDTDSAATTSGGPEATAGGRKPAVAEPISKSEAGASTREDDESVRDDVLAVHPVPPAPRADPLSPASDTCEHMSGVRVCGDRIECMACGAVSEPIASLAAEPTQISTGGSISPPAGNDAPAPSSAAQSPSVESPDDAGWQARDGHDSFVAALQVGNGKAPHPNPPTAEEAAEQRARVFGTRIPMPLRIGLDDNPIPDFLRRDGAKCPGVGT